MTTSGAPARPRSAAQRQAALDAAAPLARAHVRDSAPHDLRPGAPVGRDADAHEARLGPQDGLEPRAQHRVVVHHEDADHRASMLPAAPAAAYTGSPRSRRAPGAALSTTRRRGVRPARRPTAA